jgi:hypothetical protein
MLNHRYKSNCTWFMPPVQSVFLALMLLLAGPVWATVMVGGLENGNSILLDGKPGKLAVGVTLKNAQKIEVPRGSSITLMMDGGKTERHKGPKEFQVKDSNTSHRPNGLLIAISNLFNGWFKRGQNNSDGLNIKGLPEPRVDIPLLEKWKKIKIVADNSRKNLHLAWMGSGSSYQVNISHAHKRIVNRIVSYPSLSVNLNQFKGGDYLVEVIDTTQGSDKEGKFSIVPIAKRPPMPAKIKQEKNPETQKIAYAIWLANQGQRNEWIFEAYQLLAEMEIQAAIDIKDSLRKGTIPPNLF